MITETRADTGAQRKTQRQRLDVARIALEPLSRRLARDALVGDEKINGRVVILSG